MNDLSIQLLIVAASVLFVCLASSIVYFIFLYQKRQIQNRLEREGLQSAFRQELLQAQIEVQEQTLIHISREIHDNITQVLSFVKLNLAIKNNINEVQKQSKIEESRNLISQVINDLRDLSKSLSYEHIMQLGLVKTIILEAERINKSGIINTELLIDGNPYSLGEQCELVLFRIFQEGLNNTLKHSGAKDLKISLQYGAGLFNLTLEDNGSGFSGNLPGGNMGAGLKNIMNRATLIGAVAAINSTPGNGCCIKVSLNPLEQHIYIDTTHPDRLSR